MFAAVHAIELTASVYPSGSITTMASEIEQTKRHRVVPVKTVVGLVGCTIKLVRRPVRLYASSRRIYDGLKTYRRDVASRIGAPNQSRVKMRERRQFQMA